LLVPVLLHQFHLAVNAVNFRFPESGLVWPRLSGYHHKPDVSPHLP
jgi:hypothetical protein